MRAKAAVSMCVKQGLYKRKNSRLIGSDAACEQLREDFAQANQHARAQCRRHIVACEIRITSGVRARGLGKAGGTPGKDVGRRGRQSAGHDTLTARKNDTCFHFRRGPGGLKVPEAIARTDVLLIARAVGRFGQRSATAVVGDDDPGVVVSRYAQTCLLDRDGLPLEDVVGTHPDFGWRQRKFVNEQHGSRFPRDGRGAVDPGKASFVCAPAADKIVLHEAT